MNKIFKKCKIAVVGLGYVGLPLAVEFGKKQTTIGFDINKYRIKTLKSFNDKTKEISKKDLKKAKKLSYTWKIEDIRNCQIFIITVPTPIDKFKQPDLSSLEKSSEAIGSILKKGDIVVYESTVYPGTTEEVCVPILEKASGLKFNKDFYCGYSPERINPGDRNHRLENIKKVVSGSNSKITNKIVQLYKKIIKAGVFKAESIKIAEAAKIIENTQRDVNIALINELAIIFNKLNIDTESVLKAAETKWNFLPFKPGLVGGHCIGVDPYYLAHKALKVGYNPEIILAGRRLNDSMGVYVVEQVFKLMNKKRAYVANSTILIMGFTFKENCSDYRNTRVVDLVTEFIKYNCNVEIYDPWIDIDEAKKKYNYKFIDIPKTGKYDAILYAVAHNKFKNFSISQIKKFGKRKHIIYDIKHCLNSKDTDGRL